MKIQDHRLVEGWYRRSPHSGGPLSDPSLLVMHVTASGGTSPKGDADFFLSAPARTSAHVIVGRDGSLLQVVPFNVRAWHAGKSIWRGRPNCNDFALGIEIDNWGRLQRSEDGVIRSWTGEPVPEDRVVRLTHKHETAPSLWETFPPAQLACLTELTRALLSAYPTIEEVVGHDDIAPGRKVDPGPAFPMDRFAASAPATAAAGPRTRKVIASGLNARGGPGVEYDVLGVFPRGRTLTVLYDRPDAWAQVAGALADGAEVTAWVADQYLR